MPVRSEEFPIRPLRPPILNVMTVESLLLSGYQIIVPEIADYEVRRELLRAGKTRGLARLDLVKNTHSCQTKQSPEHDSAHCPAVLRLKLFDASR